jgi:glucose/mannose-6-phosphate isomerase
MTEDILFIKGNPDPQDMIGYITDLPGQLERAWAMGADFPLPSGDVRRVVIVGLGGSAIGADLVSAYVEPFCKVPVILRRNYGLPAYAADAETLLVFSSKSGNTEEVLDAFDVARDYPAQKVVVTTGGRLADLAKVSGIPLWKFDHPGEPRTAVGYSFGLLLALLDRLDLIPAQDTAIGAAVSAMRGLRGDLGMEQPLESNSARQLARKMYNRWPVVIGSDFLAPVARRWRTQIAELAKAMAQFEELPEADHNMLEAVHFPEELRREAVMVFLEAGETHARNQLRSRFSRERFEEVGLETALVQAVGEHPLAQQWTTLYFGDFAAYYLALQYGVNPTPVPSMQALKARLAGES